MDAGDKAAIPVPAPPDVDSGLPLLLRPTLDKLSLRLVPVDGGWWLVQRRGFDMVVKNEPYHALQVNINSIRSLVALLMPVEDPIES